MRTIKPFWYAILIALSGLASGCLYRMPIQQGNVLNPDLVAQLEPGMTRSQVLFLLGTPMIPNGFNTDRWDYYFYYKAPRGSYTASSRLTVWFKNEKVDHLEGDAAPKKTTTTPAPTPKS